MPFLLSNLPLPGVLYDKVKAAREVGVTGALATWTMATLPTLNSFAAGRLLAHDGDLPPREAFLRALARELAVNQNTILHVYEQLTSEGLLQRRHGDGTYVALELPEGRLEAQRQRLEDAQRKYGNYITPDQLAGQKSA